MQKAKYALFRYATQTSTRVVHLHFALTTYFVGDNYHLIGGDNYLLTQALTTHCVSVKD